MSKQKNSTSTVKVALIGGGVAIIVALIGIVPGILKKDKIVPPPTTPTTQTLNQTSSGKNSPNIQGVEGPVTITIENNKVTE